MDATVWILIEARAVGKRAVERVVVVVIWGLRRWRSVMKLIKASRPRCDARWWCGMRRVVLPVMAVGRPRPRHRRLAGRAHREHWGDLGVVRGTGALWLRLRIST